MSITSLIQFDTSSIVVFITQYCYCMLLLHPFYCTFVMYSAIRLSSHKCAINSVFSVQRHYDYDATSQLKTQHRWRWLTGEGASLHYLFSARPFSAALSVTRCQSTFRTWIVSLPFETNSRHTFLPHLIHNETYPPQRLCILSLGGLYGALQIFMLCYVTQRRRQREVMWHYVCNCA